MISSFSSFGFRGSIPPSRINTDKRDFEMRHRKVKYKFAIMNSLIFQVMQKKVLTVSLNLYRPWR